MVGGMGATVALVERAAGTLLRSLARITYPIFALDR